MWPVYSYLKQTNVLSIIVLMHTHYQLSFGFNEPDGGVTEFVPADDDKWFIALWGEHLRVCGAKQDGYCGDEFYKDRTSCCGFCDCRPSCLLHKTCCLSAYESLTHGKNEVATNM